MRRDGTAEERARAAGKAVAEAVNEMGFDVESFADEILRQHRTIQQNAFGAFLAVIKAWAELPPSHYDLRNEFTVEQSRRIALLLGKYGFKPPFI